MIHFKKIFSVSFVFALAFTFSHPLLAGALTDINQVRSMERALFRAAEHGDIEEIRELHRQGVNLYSNFDGNPNAVHYAAEAGQTEALRVLVIDLGIDVNVRTSNHKKMAMHYAAEAGQTEALRVLVNELGANIEAVDKYGRTAVHHAADMGQTEALRVLVNELGANVKAMDNRGRVAVHYAAGFGQLETLRVLVNELKVSVEAKDKKGRTAVHYSVVCARVETLDVLVNELQADVVDGLSNIGTSLGNKEVERERRDLFLTFCRSRLKRLI